MVLIYTAAGKPLLEAVFGKDLTLASGALPWLGLAMVLLACTYLSVQYLLALHRYRFIWILAAGVVAEVAALAAVGDDLTRVAMALLGVQAVCAGVVLFLALRAAGGRPAGGRRAPSAWTEPARALAEASPKPSDGPANRERVSASLVRDFARVAAGSWPQRSDLVALDPEAGAERRELARLTGIRVLQLLDREPARTLAKHDVAVRHGRRCRCRPRGRANDIEHLERPAPVLAQPPLGVQHVGAGTLPVADTVMPTSSSR